MTFDPRRLALILLLPALAACAADGDGPPERGVHENRPRRPLPNVFISPAGEPFRAAPGAPYPVVDWFSRADALHEGKLTREAFRADAMRFFDRLDTNHDGVISADEIDHAPASLKTLLKNGATELKREDLRPARATQQAQG